MNIVVTPPHLLLTRFKRFTSLFAVCVIWFTGVTSAKEDASIAAPQQGVELLFPAGTGKQEKGVKLSKEQKKAASLLKKLKAIEKGGNVNAVDKLGQTALMHAAAQGEELALYWLVAKGADVTLKSKSGKTAADLLQKLREKQADYEYINTLETMEQLLEACEIGKLSDDEKKRIGNPGVEDIVKAFEEASGDERMNAARMLHSGVELRNVPFTLKNGKNTRYMIALMARCGVNLRTDLAPGHPLFEAEFYDAYTNENNSRKNLRLAMSLGLDPKPTKMTPEDLMRYALLMGDDANLKKVLEQKPELIDSEDLLSYPFSAATTTMLLKEGKLDVTKKEIADTLTYATLAAGDVKKMRVLLKAGLNVDKQSLLMEAACSDDMPFGAQRGAQRVIPALLEAGAVPNAEMLISAARNNYMQACEQLIAKGAPLKDEKGYTLLQAICSSGAFLAKDEKDIALYSKLVKHCIDAGLDVTVERKDERQGNLHSYNLIDDVISLHQEPLTGGCIIISPETGKEVLSIVQMLLKAGAKVSENALGELSNGIPSDIAEEIALLLLDHGANPLSEGVLTSAGYRGKRIAQRLIDAGCKMDDNKLFCWEGVPWTAEAAEVFIKAGATVPKDVCARMIGWFEGGHGYDRLEPDVESLKKLVRVFADAGADLEHALVQKYDQVSNQRRALKAILQSGANPNAADEQGDSSLMLFIASDKATVGDVAAFLDAGADVSHKNKAGKTALQIAKEKKLDDIVKVLEEHGAKE